MAFAAGHTRFHCMRTERNGFHSFKGKQITEKGKYYSKDSFLPVERKKKPPVLGHVRGFIENLKIWKNGHKILVTS